jgi:hypothetical protein
MTLSAIYKECNDFYQLPSAVLLRYERQLLFLGFVHQEPLLVVHLLQAMFLETIMLMVYVYIHTHTHTHTHIAF